ncbi:MAG: ThiF family adenylyltransferase [Caldilineaceae bacterium]|nr:ThiF family adenylyltransferase [Caldilineaceae bacterium]MDE0501394.1 ThiF family adenylyltransferase [bacterium]
MSSLKFTDPRHWEALEKHLAGGVGERFAFAHTRYLQETSTGPLLEVTGIELIEDTDVTGNTTGWYLSDNALDRVHNAALRGSYGLIEFHNHSVGPPRFSHIDKANIPPMASYVASLIPDQPYGAGVYAEGRVYVEHWTKDGNDIHRGEFRSVIVCGHQLRLVNAPAPTKRRRLARQDDLLGAWGSATLKGLRVAVVGLGGTGSHVALALAYLGVGELLLLDSDCVETTNLNRVVTAGVADVGAPKTLVARRRLREIDPGLRCTALAAITPDKPHPELEDVDLIVGCVDHDGPRDRLNQIGVDTATPYLDIATGIDLDAEVPIIGGRVIFVRPGGPCLHCFDELDPMEVGRWAKDPSQQALDRQHGYGTLEPDPAVVHLNGITTYAAIGELIAWIAGWRSPAQFLDIDLSGFLEQSPGTPGSRATPRRPSEPLFDCLSCSHLRGSPVMGQATTAPRSKG